MNERINAPKLMIIDDEGNNIGVLSKEEALSLARERELDLVLIATNTEIPVARIVDWAKFKYEKNKKLKNSKGKASTTKEWWFNPTIEERDIELKLNSIKKFLEKGGKAKITVRFLKDKRHKRIDPKQLEETMQKIEDRYASFADKVSDVVKEGRNIVVYIVKSKNKKLTNEV